MTNQTSRWPVLSGSGRIALIVSIIVITWCSSSARQLAAGGSGEQLDPTFGNGGKVRTKFGDFFDVARAVAIQEDQKIVVAGSSATRATGYDFAVARLNADGTFDTSFGSGGKVTRDFRLSDDRAVAVVIQPDGKIVLAGTVNVPGPPEPHTDFAVIRFHPDGRPDLSFGERGWALADLGSKFFERASSVVLQRDGKIVVGGETFFSRFDSNFGIVRFNANGSIDTSFGTDGIVVQSFGPDVSSTVGGLAVLPDTTGPIAGDKIIAAGFAGNPGLDRPYDFALARYNPDGSLDPSFGGGLVTTDFEGGHDLANAVVVQPGGKIIAAGGTSKPFGVGTAFGLVRYNLDGSLDPHFGIGGRVTTSFPISLDPAVNAPGDVMAEAFAVAIHDGKIVAFGDHIVDQMERPNGIDFIGARYLIDGSLDKSFGTGGLVMTDFTETPGVPSDDYGTAVAIQKDGKIVGAGWLRGATPLTDVGLVRYLASSGPGTF